MNEFPPELLIYAAIFIGILLFNYFVQRIAKWQKQQEELPRPEARPREQRRVETVRRVRPAPVLRSVPAMPDVRSRRLETPVVRRRPVARSFLRGRQNLRRAIVVMTVLGPCRAEKPYDFP